MVSRLGMGLQRLAEVLHRTLVQFGPLFKVAVPQAHELPDLGFGERSEVAGVKIEGETFLREVF